MYIKQVIIQGFRSYRDQTIVEPFSPRHNVIVGRNGSGKSNFFFAIQFVLSDEFNNLRPEQRQQLLHEGPGPRVVSAFVEIIFDNTEGRLPVERDEVSLRRVIGSKKDQYFLDKKNVTKSDVVNLLESAGLSRSNPYYIVKQGKINELATAPDSQRLNLLREIAGTRVYDEKREESKAILKETDLKREKVTELIQAIEERLSTLSEEKEELEAYQKLDKMRRSLEYTVHDKELRTAREQLDDLEDSRRTTSDRANSLAKKAAEASEKVQGIDRDLNDVSSRADTLTRERQQLEVERQDFIRQRAKLELSVKDLEDGVSEHSKGKDRMEGELRQLNKNIKTKEDSLSKITPKFQQLRAEEEQMSARLKISEQRVSELYAKQGRGQQFRSKEDRDVWIKKEAKALSATIVCKEDQLRTVRDEATHLKQRLETLDTAIQERNAYLEDRRQAMDQANKSHVELKKQRDDLTNERKEVWREEDSMKQTLHSSREELNQVERNLRTTVSKSVNAGLEAVRRIIEEKKLEGVYGPLIENFECDEKFFTAVEVTAGGRLFHIIVDNDKTATTILQHMNRQKLSGEVTFMPLNRMHTKETEYPNSADVIPMIQRLNFNPAFRQIMLNVFGKTLICRTIEVASQFSQSSNLDCITLAGDQVSRRGAMTGGFYDSRRSRMAAQRSKSQLVTRMEADQGSLDKVVKRLAELDGQITEVLGNLQRVETQQVHLRESYDREKVNVRGLIKEQQMLVKTIATKENTLNADSAELKGLNSTLQALSAELGTDLLSQLDTDDQSELADLRKLVDDIKSAMRRCISERSHLEKEKNGIENELSTNLCRRRDELVQELDDISVEDRQQQLSENQSDLRSVVQNLDRAKQRLDEVDRNLDDFKQRQYKLRAELEQWIVVEQERREAMEEDSKNMERVANQRTLLLKKKEECMHKIRELGSLPADAFEKYQSMGLKKLFRKLQECNSDLKKYSHVNQKALDQYITFSEQKERLVKRGEEQTKSYDAIVELMDVLEQRKHEQLEFTFKQVSKYFSEIFKELVANGIGRLQMVRGDAETQGAAAALETLKGVRILVSFSGQSSEMRDMQQLSGGQKSIVALTLIFSIQKCDPAPFYLFDEIDQALDTTHRKAVADKIKQSADNAQFITTTFRPELLDTADKFYGVRFRYKVSTVERVSREDAEEFVVEQGEDAH
ncbi:structural maintenance of chromosomes protein 3-like [Sycon ciliatum]|uniref:structural maintenance of chromosomes protein 3-like n=1 Tax=Sycon ciliatum TaxID=27933 RepID=UPI0031F64404